MPIEGEGWKEHAKEFVVPKETRSFAVHVFEGKGWVSVRNVVLEELE